MPETETPAAEVRSHRVLLIDPFAKTVTEASIPSNDPRALARLLLCPEHADLPGPDGQPITERCPSSGPRIFTSPFDGTTVQIFVDDEGLFRRGQKFFKITGISDPIPGRAVAIASNYEGETVDVPHYITARAVDVVLTWHEMEDIADQVAPITISTAFGDGTSETVSTIPIDIRDARQWSE